MDLSHLSPKELGDKIQETIDYTSQFLDCDPEGSELDAILDGMDTAFQAMKDLLPTASEAQLEALEQELRQQGYL